MEPGGFIKFGPPYGSVNVAGMTVEEAEEEAEMEDEFLLLHRHFPYQLAEVNPDCRAHLAEIYNCLVDIFETAIIRGQQDGSIGGVPAHKTALILFSTVDGLVRFNTYKLYEAGPLYNELMACCRRILQPE